MSQRKHSRWLHTVCELVSARTGLTYAVPLQNKHIKVPFYFPASPEKQAIWLVGSTPSDRRAERNAVTSLKRALRERFGLALKVASHETGFTFTRSVGDVFKDEDTRTSEAWDAFFEELCALPLDE